MLGRVTRCFALFLAAAGASGACGRLSFDGQVDGRPCLDPVGHDEDGDGIDDACDVCPQLVDDQLDTDGDNVGDACDLAATQEQRLMFDPFTAMRGEWTYDAMGTFNGDSITLPGIGRTSVMRIFTAPGRTILELGARITEVEAGGFAQIALHIGRIGSPENYYCEFYENGIDNRLKITAFVTSYQELAVSSVVDPPAVGAEVRMVFEHRPPDLHCVAWWNGARFEVAAADPGGITPEQMTISINDLAVEATYFSRLATP
jgi:hypothetical protein